MTPGAEHEENRIHCRTIRHARVVAAQRVPRPWWQKGLHLCPQIIRQAPAVIANPPSGLPRFILPGHVLNMERAALPAYRDRLLAWSDQAEKVRWLPLNGRNWLIKFCCPVRMRSLSAHSRCSWAG